MDNRAANRNLILLYLYWALGEFQIWIPVWIVFLTLNQGFTLTQVTVAEGLYLVGVVALEVPTGAVADHWGRSRSMSMGAFCLAVAVLIFAFTTTFAVLLVSFLLWSVASTLMSGADHALLFDTLKAVGREHQFEKIAGRGAALSWSGAGLATAIGGPVAGIIDIETTIYIGAATCMVTSLLALAMREAPRTSPETPEHYVASIRTAFGEVWRRVDVRFVILLAGMGLAAIQVGDYLVQPYLLDRGVEVGLWFSLLQVPMIFAGAAGALLAGFIGGRAGAIAALIGTGIGGIGLYLALATAPGLWAYAAIPAMFALAACVEPITAGYVNRRISSERRATILSMQSMASSLTLALYVPAAGYITDEWGLTTAFAVSAGATAVALLVFGLPLLGAGRTPPTQPMVAAGGDL